MRPFFPDEFRFPWNAIGLHATGALIELIFRPNNPKIIRKIGFVLVLILCSFILEFENLLTFE
jgi:hypothetical protein